MRYALIVACDHYEDPALQRLRAPVHDARGLAQVLGDPAIGDYRVRPLINRPVAVINEEIEDFFTDRRRDDLLLLYFSCHGIKNEDGRLYFAGSNTNVRRLAATGISSVFVNEQIARSRSTRKVLLLDCCYSGAFARGLTPRGGGDGQVDVEEHFEGRGLAVITASDAMEYAWEEAGELTLDAARPSIFSAAVISGLKTGAADLDEDGQISIGDLYDHVFEQVQQEMPSQTPTKFEHGVQGELVIAKSVRTLLPLELRQAAASPYPGVRVAAVEELRQLLQGRDHRLALEARQRLEHLQREDSSDRVRSAAEDALQDSETVTVGHETLSPDDLPRSVFPQAQLAHPVRTTEPPVTASNQDKISYEWTPSRPDGADLEMSLRWNRERNGLDISLRFKESPSEIATRLLLDKPLSIDIEMFNRLSDDEPVYGAALTDMVFTAEIAEFYLLALAEAERRNCKLRFRLHIDAPEAFHALRWESLRDPVSGEPIAMRPNVLLSRYLSSPDWPDLVLGNQGLRALIMVAGPWDIGAYHPRRRFLAPVKVEEELERARRALAGFQVVELAFGTATLANMMETLHQGIDVLYLVCHGSLSGDVPQLYLEKSDGTADVIDGRNLAECLSEVKQRPTVVMLCSCQSTSSGGEACTVDEGHLSALSRPLASAGVAAVVAMQANVSAKTAATFAPAFFAAFAKHGIVDEAMAAARGAIRNEKDWWVPVLFSRLPTGRTYFSRKFGKREAIAWNELELTVANSLLTPVLGPGLTDPILGSLQDIARRWVQLWQLPIALPDQSNLAKVAQYHARNGRREAGNQLRYLLAQGIKDRRNQAEPNDPVWDLPDDLLTQETLESAVLEIGRRLRSIDQSDPHSVLAALPMPVYVTTGWTFLLQEALLAQRKMPTTLFFDWTKRKRWEDDTKDLTPTVHKPLVYHLFGRLDEPDSLVLTEDDQFRWLNALVDRHTSIPTVVLRVLSDGSLLFLGYRQDDWPLRFVLRGINNFSAGSLLRDNHHMAVLPNPGNHEMGLAVAEEFGRDRISVYYGETKEFLCELWQRISPIT
jgi:hypothetical protein